MSLTRYVTEKQMEDLEARAGMLRKNIEEAKLISKGDADAVKKALERFKNYRVWLQNKIDDNFRKSSVTRMIQNQEWAGQLWAMTMVISTFENAKADVNQYGSQLSTLEKQINEWKKLPKRE